MAKPIILTRALAHATAWDEANRHMAEAGRATWNEADYNIAVRKFNELSAIAEGAL